MLQHTQTEFAENLMDAMLDEKNAVASHFKIYQHNITMSLIAVLLSAYPLVTKILGKEYFTQCAHEYIRRYPSRSSNLHDYGAYFAYFLTEYEPTQHLEYLAEVAEFEWICHTLHYAADHPPLNISKLESISSQELDQLRFILHPASALKVFQYPILDILDLCRGEIDHDVNIRKGGVNLLIIRRELDIKLVILTPAEFTFLNSLSEGHALIEALEAAHTIHPVDLTETSFKLEEKLPQWVKDKTLVDCY